MKEILEEFQKHLNNGGTAKTFLTGLAKNCDHQYTSLWGIESVCEYCRLTPEEIKETTNTGEGVSNNTETILTKFKVNDMVIISGTFTGTGNVYGQVREVNTAKKYDSSGDPFYIVRSYHGEEYFVAERFLTMQIP